MFDEAARIGATIETLAGGPLADAELVVVDDGSRDDSVRIANETFASVGAAGTVLERDHGGKGAAIAAGAAAAGGEVIVFVDADLSTDVESIVRVRDAVSAEGVDVAIGSRRHPDSVIARTQPWFRGLSGRAFSVAVRAMGLSQRSDTQCGLKGFTRDAAGRTLGAIRSQGYAFDVEVLMLADQAGLSVVEVPVRWEHADGSAVRVARDLVPVTRELLALRRRR